MKTISTITFLVFAVAVASAQIKINIPKIGPKPTPQATPMTTATPDRTNSNTVSTVAASDLPLKPVANENPVFLKTTLDIRCDTLDTYWKMGENKYNFTSWVPQVKFKVFYKGNERLRYKAEYFLPNGAAWFSEPLEENVRNGNEQTAELNTPRTSNKHENTSTDAVGTFGIKITDKNGEVVFEGKYKVAKYKPDALPKIPMWKNVYTYYVDQDWNLPIGYVWLDYSRDQWSPLTAVTMWLKGEYTLGQHEARLFYNGAQIATTDDMGEISAKQRRFPNRNDDKAASQWEEYVMAWYKFHAFLNPRGSMKYPQSKFMKDMPDDYTVKLFYQGTQIREANFKVGSDGNLVDHGIASKNKLGAQKVVIPVKVIGTGKWNLMNWKTDAFYANPLNGFIVP
ncbi:MAG: hypothetical protein IPK58_23640 [Acidobacteria bacterium]|nr:hypothetical protein [Acidobacteriota bacterium]